MWFLLFLQISMENMSWSIRKIDRAYLKELIVNENAVIHDTDLLIFGKSLVWETDTREQRENWFCVYKLVLLVTIYWKTQFLYSTYLHYLTKKPLTGTQYSQFFYREVLSQFRFQPFLNTSEVCSCLDQAKFATSFYQLVRFHYKFLQ